MNFFGFPVYDLYFKLPINSYFVVITVQYCTRNNFGYFIVIYNHYAELKAFVELIRINNHSSMYLNL